MPKVGALSFTLNYASTLAMRSFVYALNYPELPSIFHISSKRRLMMSECIAATCSPSLFTHDQRIIQVGRDTRRSLVHPPAQNKTNSEFRPGCQKPCLTQF